MSIKIGIGKLRIGTGGGKSWESTLYNQADLNFWYKSDRSGLTLPDTINPGIGDATVLLPCFKTDRSNSTELFTLATPKNIGTVYSIYWRGRLDNVLTNQVLSYSSTDSGCWLHSTSRYWYHKAGNTAVQSANNAVSAGIFTDNLFHDFAIIRNGLSVDFYVDGVAQGVTLTLGANTNFTLSSMTGGTNYKWAYISEMKVHTSIKTPALSKTDTPNSNWFIFTGLICTDVLNGECLARGTYNGFDNAYYSAEGSQYLLNYGCSVFIKAASQFAYIPYKTDLTPSIPGVLITTDGFKLYYENAGSATKFNLSDYMVDIPGAAWDRSDVTLWNDNARVAISGAGYYDSVNPNRWHSSELNQSTIILYGTTLHKSICFTKLTDNSYDNAANKVLEELFSYDNNKTGDDLLKVFLYTGDTGVHAIDYYFSNTHYCATYLDKILAFDDVDTLSLSTDGGATFPTTLQIVGMENQIQFAYIFENGNILFCTHTKAYYSTDSLATYGESSMQDADGSPATLGTYSNFRPVTLNQRVKIGATEIVVWGRYIASADEYEGYGYRTINAVWYSLDGTVVKKAYQIQVTEPVLPFYHIHAVCYDAVDNCFYMQTGDGVGSEHLIKGVYNVNTGLWAWTLIASSTTESRIQSTGIVFDADYCYLGEEYYHRFIRTTRANIANRSEYVVIHDSPLNTQGFVTLTGTFIDEMIIIENGINNTITTSFDKIVFITRKLYGGVSTNDNSYFIVRTKNSNGYYLVEIYQSTETLITLNRGQVLMLRVIKPED